MEDTKKILFTDDDPEIREVLRLLLASHQKKVFSAQNIYESVWNEPYFYTSNNTVMVHIRNIRRKLGDDPQNCRAIRTVWGKGYRIEQADLPEPGRTAVLRGAAADSGGGGIMEPRRH